MTDDLEQRVETASLENLSLTDLRKFVVAEETVNHFGSPTTTYYIFFPKTGTSVQIPLGQTGVYISLEPDNYGLKREVEAIVESSGAEVNNAMAYDFEKIEDALSAEIEKAEGSLRLAKEQEREYYRAMKRDYQPKGNERIKGVCSDAGEMIRERLYETLSEQYGVILVSANNGRTTHDTTLVFNKETGHWAVVNSKSPVKEYNLVPKEKLAELGTPYMGI
jgi:hypothetical protein